MKKLLYISFIVLLLTSCIQKQTTYSIKLNIDSISKKDIIYLYGQKENRWRIIDSIISDDKKLFFSGSVKKPELHYIAIKNKRFSFPIYVENSNITVSGIISKPNEVKISGSTTQDQYYNYIKEISNIRMKITPLYAKYEEAFKTKNKIKISEFEKEVEVIEKEVKDYSFNYILNNPKKIIALRVANENTYIFDYSELKKIATNFDTTITNSKSFLAIDHRLKILEKVSIGNKYTDVTLKDINGKEVFLSSFIGKKYILIDFWASWCNPCRRENPNVLAVYNAYKTKGFDIVGISLDHKKEDWIKAIKEDGLIWNHFSDLKGWGSKAAQIYGVMAVPHSILINPKGIIIAKNLRGEELKSKISELLD